MTKLEYYSQCDDNPLDCQIKKAAKAACHLEMKKAAKAAFFG